MTELSEIFNSEQKSKIKAGDGLLEGKYKFYTCSNEQTKFYNEAQYTKESLIFGTGGNPSVHYSKEPFSTSTDCLVFTNKSSKQFNLKAVYYGIISNMNLLEKGFKGIGLKHISKDYILKINLNIPEKNKQDKIVSVLDKINSLIQKREKQLSKLDQLAKSRFIEMFGEPSKNDMNWNVLKLDRLGKLERGKSKHRPRNDPALLGGDYPLIQTGEITKAGLYLSEYSNTYSELGLKQSKLWDENTLCITIAANIAQTSILKIKACFPDSVVGFIHNAQTNNIFIHYWFCFFQNILEQQAPQVAQKNINLSILNDLDVIVPPISLQNEFASFIEQLDKSKFTIKKSLEKLNQTYRALLQEYFG